MNLLKLSGIAGAVAVGLTAMPALAQWQPDRPINIIVPWSAGGSTDQVTRVVAPLLEEALGTPVVVVNQPGASGSIGTQAALEAPRDGYTWTANAIANNATYAVTGLVEDTSIDDYRIYLHVANVPVCQRQRRLALPGLRRAARGDEGSGEGHGRHRRGELLRRHGARRDQGSRRRRAWRARMVTYDGGNPAVLAAASGEVDATTQLAVEQTEMIRAGRLRPLAVLSDKPLEVEGIDPIPPITDFMPGLARSRRTISACSSRSARRRRSTTPWTRSGRRRS